TADHPMNTKFRHELASLQEVHRELIAVMRAKQKFYAIPDESAAIQQRIDVTARRMLQDFPANQVPAANLGAYLDCEHSLHRDNPEENINSYLREIRIRLANNGDFSRGCVFFRTRQVGKGTDKRLVNQASILGVVADPTVPGQEAVAQGRAAKPLSGPAA